MVSGLYKTQKKPGSELNVLTKSQKIQYKSTVSVSAHYRMIYLHSINICYDIFVPMNFLISVGIC